MQLVHEYLKKILLTILVWSLALSAYGGPTISGGGGSSTQASLHIDDILTALGIASEAATMPNGTGSVWPDGSTQAAINQALETAVEGKADTSSLTPDAATAAGPLCKDEAGQVVNCGNLEDVAYPTVATSLIEEAANLQAADFNGLKPFGWIGGNLTLPTAAAHLYRPFGIGFPSGTYGLVPASYLDVISYNGTAITAGYTLACSGVGLYSIMGTGANAWHVFGPASGCTEGTTPFLADLDLSVSSLSFTGEEAKSVTVTNNGDRAATPTTSLTTGTHFSISADTCDGEEIAPEGTCQVEVTSDGTGEYEDTLNIAYNDYPDHAASESPLQVSLSEESAGCSVDTDTAIVDYTGLTAAANAVIGGASNLVLATQVALGATSYTITQYQLKVDSVVGAGNVTCSLYTDSSNAPGDQISGTSVVLSITTAGVKDFVLATPKTGQTGTVWVQCAGSTDMSIMSKIASATGIRSLSGNGNLDNYAGWQALFGCAE